MASVTVIDSGVAEAKEIVLGRVVVGNVLLNRVSDLVVGVSEAVEALVISLSNMSSTARMSSVMSSSLSHLFPDT